MRNGVYEAPHVDDEPVADDDHVGRRGVEREIDALDAALRGATLHVRSSEEGPVAVVAADRDDVEIVVLVEIGAADEHVEAAVRRRIELAPVAPPAERNRLRCTDALRRRRVEGINRQTGVLGVLWLTIARFPALSM